MREYPVTVIKSVWRRLEKPRVIKSCVPPSPAMLDFMQHITSLIVANWIKQGHLPPHKDWQNFKFDPATPCKGHGWIQVKNEIKWQHTQLVR